VRPVTGGGNDPFAPPPSGSFSRPGSGAVPDPFAPPPSGNIARPGSGAGPDPFDAPPETADSIGLEMGAAALPALAARAPAPEPAAPEEPSLELDTGSHRSNDEFRRPPQTVGGAAALNVSRIAATSSASGLAVDKNAEADAYRVRCDKHGLFFDTRRASGCAKCLAPGRKMGVAMAEKARGFKLMEFDDQPIKRAFIGLAIALVMGFIPAAYHALGMGSREMRRLREEQEMVSRRPATEEIARRFEEIDATVGATKSRYMRNTGLIWVMVTGGALFGWYRLT
jgi:hypothetical protein